MRLLRLAAGGLVLTLVLAGSTLSAGAAAPAGEYIVVLKGGAGSPADIADEHGKMYGFKPEIVYGHALRGYAAMLPGAAVAAIESRPDVQMVARNVPVAAFAPKPPPPPPEQPPQTAPTGVARVGALRSSIADIDGKDDRRVDADIAVLDTGISTVHPDLSLAGGVGCTGDASFADDNGHGTHVAGTAGAIDNAIGVVGVAAGARVWAVKMLGSNGGGSLKWALCGVDWVTANAETIDVANLSWGAKGEDDANCGLTNGDPLHLAICNSVAAGVTYVAAAGNDGAPIAQVPAAYDEVITVSALADYDGRPGGAGAAPSTCGAAIAGADDTFATFSNYGIDVDLAAPGVCINSTWPFRIYRVGSGTSMSAPHVAGGAALYLANNPTASPAQVRTALLAAAEPGPVVGDPDAFPEPVLNVARL